MEVLIVGAVVVVALALIAWTGQRMLRSGQGGAGMADAFGSFIDVFDPARAQADRDLKSQKHQGTVIPSPDDDDPGLVVDLKTGTARVRRPPAPPE